MSTSLNIIVFGGLKAAQGLAALDTIRKYLQVGPERQINCRRRTLGMWYMSNDCIGEHLSGQQLMRFRTFLPYINFGASEFDEQMEMATSKVVNAVVDDLDSVSVAVISRHNLDVNSPKVAGVFTGYKPDIIPMVALRRARWMLKRLELLSRCRHNSFRVCVVSDDNTTELLTVDELLELMTKMAHLAVAAA